MLAFGVFERHRRRHWRCCGFELGPRHGQHRAFRQDDRALDHVLQLANVAGPGPPAQYIEAFAGHRFDRPAKPLREPLREVEHEWRDVVGSLA